MNSCNLDHSRQDVMKKLSGQKPFLPVDLVEQCNNFLSTSVNQEQLNELFHLLKKYDLSSDEEREIRHQKMKLLFGKKLC
jgi:hypothetical protein